MSARALRNEQGSLHSRLYEAPRGTTHPPPGTFGSPGLISLRQLLTFVSHWRGADTFLHPAGIWPHRFDSDNGPRFHLGPIPCPQFPLLTDAQILALLCEGSPFFRPAVATGLAILANLRLDVHRSDARMRAILCASLFYEWREGSYIWRANRRTFDITPGAGCRLAQTRATMARLIAGLSVDLVQAGPAVADPGYAQVVIYAPDAIPAGGFRTGGVIPDRGAGPPQLLALPPHTGPPAGGAVAPPAGADHDGALHVKGFSDRGELSADIALTSP